jgi:hypothetical protein
VPELTAVNLGNDIEPPTESGAVYH